MTTILKSLDPHVTLCCTIPAMYTVKQLSTLAGVSIRTLHYYDEIGLLKPAQVGENSYRYYTNDSLFILQQILLYRELGFRLAQIKMIIHDPDFDLVSALQQHRKTLLTKIGRLHALVATVDTTIMHLVGEVNMSKKHIFAGFDETKQKQYEKQAIKQYGEEEVKATTKRWNNYSDNKKAQIKKEGSDIYEALAAAIPLGAASPEVYALLVRWHNHLRYFYEPSFDRLRGLGNSYNDQPDFQATFTAIDPQLPPFLQKAINLYVDRLENI